MRRRWPPPSRPCRRRSSRSSSSTVCRATGTGVEVRITEERASDGDIAVLGTLALPDTGGAWSVFALDCFPVRLDRSRYRLEARTGVAIDVALCGFSMSLLEAR